MSSSNSNLRKKFQSGRLNIVESEKQETHLKFTKYRGNLQELIHRCSPHFTCLLTKQYCIQSQTSVVHLEKNGHSQDPIPVNGHCEYCQLVTLELLSANAL